MAFDVTLPLDTNVPDDFNSGAISVGPIAGASDRTRKVALFEGKDEFGRLQPLLGTAEPATDDTGAPIDWPATPVYQQAKIPDGTPAGILSPLVGQMEGSIAWHSPTTENPASGDTEIWEIWNVTGDAHPVHLHLVNFKEIVPGDGVALRQEINYDTNIDEDGFVPMFNLAIALVGAAETAVVVTTAIPPGDIPSSGTLRVVDDNGVYLVVDYISYVGNTFTITPTDFSGVNASAGNNVYVTMDDGIFKVMQPTVQHNSVAGDASTYGVGFRIIYPSNPNEAYGSVVSTPSEYVENAPKDMVTALPDQITRIKATFDKDGRYVWHCHILSHEDHEMMRVLQVG
jgi:FtsP/CotA-like multicopper oxidase with cupredoxin domain